MISQTTGIDKRAFRDWFVDSDGLRGLLANLNPYEVAAAAERAHLPAAYLAGGGNVPSKWTMTSSNAGAYAKFLHEVGKLKGIDGNVSSHVLKDTGRNMTVDLPISRENGKVQSIDAIYDDLEARQARLEGLLYTKERIADMAKFNADLADSSLMTRGGDFGPVSRNMDMKTYVSPLDREAADYVAEAGLKGAEAAKAEAAVSAELRRQVQEELNTVFKQKSAIRRQFPNMVKPVEEKWHALEYGGTLADRTSYLAAGAVNGDSSGYARKFLDNIKYKAGKGMYKGLKAIGAPDFVANIPGNAANIAADWTVGMGIDAVDDAANVKTQLRNNRATGGGAFSNDERARIANINMVGRDGSNIWQNGLGAAVTGTISLVPGAAFGKAGLKGGAKLLRIPLKDKVLTKPLLPAAKTFKGKVGRFMLENTPIAAPGVADMIATQGYTDEDVAKAEGVERKWMEGKEVTPQERLLYDNVAGAVRKSEQQSRQKQPAQQPAQQQPKPSAAPKPATGGGKPWYKNPWVWLAGAGTLLGGGMLAKEWMDSRRRRREEYDYAARMAAVDAMRRNRAAAMQARRSAPPMVPYDYRQEQPITVGGWSGDDPFDFYTGDYYY